MGPTASYYAKRPAYRLRARLLLSAVLAVAIVSATAQAIAGNLADGRKKAAMCGVCHGKDGIAKRPDVPNIAGQNDFYMRKQLLAYRSGQRVHPEMNIIAKGLSDQDIDDLVTWYSSVKLTVELPN